MARQEAGEAPWDSSHLCGYLWTLDKEFFSISRMILDVYISAVQLTSVFGSTAHGVCNCRVGARSISHGVQYVRPMHFSSRKSDSRYVDLYISIL